jgi:hypothetical protein
MGRLERRPRGRVLSLFPQRPDETRPDLREASRSAKMVQGFRVRCRGNLELTTARDPGGLRRRLDQEPADPLASVVRADQQGRDLRDWSGRAQCLVPVHDQQATGRAPLGGKQHGAGRLAHGDQPLGQLHCIGTVPDAGQQCRQAGGIGDRGGANLEAVA